MGTLPGSQRVLFQTAVNKSDLELIAESVDGQTTAFDTLVTRYQDQLYNALFQILRSAEDARDVSQEAFIMAWKKLETFRGDSEFFTWLFRIAYNLAMTRARKKKLPMASAAGNGYVEAVSPGPMQRPSDRLELAEQQHQVHTALAELPEEFRTVLVLKEMEDLKYEQIAEILAIPVGTVRSRLHRARLILREKLERILSGDANSNHLKATH